MDLRVLSVFVKVAELRSFVRAAKALGITQSGVSNAINRLEAEAGVVLIARTTRSVNLTEDGSAFFERCRQILIDLDEAERILTKSQIRPSGQLRLSMPVSFGRLKVLPLLGAFRSEYPDVRVHVGITDRFVDLVDEGVDVAIRMGKLTDSRLVARQLTRIQRRIVGTPDYFAKYGKPKVLSDLAKHNCLALTYHETRQVRDWLFRSAKGAETFTPRGNLSFNDGSALRSAAMAGYGLAQIHGYYVDEAIASGHLISVLERFRPSTDGISLIYAPTRHLAPKVRAFVDFLTRHF